MAVLALAVVMLVAVGVYLLLERRLFEAILGPDGQRGADRDRGIEGVTAEFVHAHCGLGRIRVAGGYRSFHVLTYLLMP